MGDDIYGDAGSTDDFSDDSGSDVYGSDAEWPVDSTQGAGATDAGDDVPDDGRFHTIGDGAIAVGRRADGTTVTSPTWGGEHMHTWRPGHNLTPGSHARSVGDEQGDMVLWDPDTGEVTTAIKDQTLPKGDSGYEVSRDIPSWDE